MIPQAKIPNKWYQSNRLGHRSESEGLVIMASIRYEFEKYSGKNNFELWKVKMISLLTKQGEDGALEERKSTMTDDDWNTLDKKVLPSIRGSTSKGGATVDVADSTSARVWHAGHGHMSGHVRKAETRGWGYTVGGAATCEKNHMT